MRPAASRKSPSVARTTLALCTTVTLLRRWSRANWKAARMMRSEPLRELILQEMAHWSGASPLKGAKEGEISSSSRDSLSGTG